jgi:hypothetical protein
MRQTMKTETKGHTPGPWTVASGQRSDDGGEAYFEIGSQDGSLSSVARCYFDPRLNEERHAALADAALIAAAPELLEALEEMVRLSDELMERHGVGIYAGGARAAIAKARGGNP